MSATRVVFASQTGFSQSYAEQIPLKLKKKINVQSCEDFDIQEFLHTNSHIYFVCSTSEGGNPPDMMQDFWDWLHDQQDNQLLANIHFTIFGVGNKNYSTTYQLVARKLKEQLISLGATLVGQYTEGDVSCPSEFEETFQKWVQNLNGL